MTSYTSQFKQQVAKNGLKTKTYSETSRKYGVPVSRVKERLALYSKYGNLAFEEYRPEAFKEQRICELERQVAVLGEGQ